MFLVLTVSWLGKRLLSLISFAGNGASCLLLGIYSYVVLRNGGAHQYEVTWLPLCLIIVLSFCSSITFEVPWMMLSEIFPFRYVLQANARRSQLHCDTGTVPVSRNTICDMKTKFGREA